MSKRFRLSHMSVALWLAESTTFTIKYYPHNYALHETIMGQRGPSTGHPLRVTIKSDYQTAGELRFDSFRPSPSPSESRKRRTTIGHTSTWDDLRQDMGWQGIATTKAVAVSRTSRPLGSSHGVLPSCTTIERAAMFEGSEKPRLAGRFLLHLVHDDRRSVQEWPQARNTELFPDTRVFSRSWHTAPASECCAPSSQKSIESW